MLFPGGAREAFKPSADKYKLMWNGRLVRHGCLAWTKVSDLPLGDSRGYGESVLPASFCGCDSACVLVARCLVYNTAAIVLLLMRTLNSTRHKTQCAESQQRLPQSVSFVPIFVRLIHASHSLGQRKRNTYS